KLRPLPAADQDSPQGHQRRLASVRAELLPPLPSGRAPCGSGGSVHEPPRVPMCHQERERQMSKDDNGDESKLKTNTLNRRNILLASTTIAAASALGTAASVQKAVAQAQQAAPAGQKPNILVIMGDDVGWFNIRAYHQGIMSGKTPNLDQLAADGLRFSDYYAEEIG